MATPYHFDLLSSLGFNKGPQNQMRYQAKYRCQVCGHSWKVKNTTGKEKQCEGRGCYAMVKPYKKEPINKKVVYRCPICSKEKVVRCTKSEVQELDGLDPPYCTVCRTDMTMVSVEDIIKPRRKFGEFYCRKCGHDWKSGYAWEGKGQECLRCGTEVFPENLRPLRPHLGEAKGEPHKSDLCEMCKEIRKKGLGESCKSYVPPPNIENEPELDLDDEDLESVVTVNSSVVSEGSDVDPEDLSPPTSDGELTPTEEREIAKDDLINAIQAMKLDK